MRPPSSPQHAVDLARSDSQTLRQFNAGERPVYRICVTGGPCAGKTTSLQNIATELERRGFKVLMVPEAATMMMKGGCFIQTEKMTFEQAVKFQIQVMRMQIHLEDVFTQIGVHSGVPCVAVMDRGVMDGAAFCDRELWRAILDETGWNHVQLRDKRYDAVIHL